MAIVEREAELLVVFATAGGVSDRLMKRLHKNGGIERLTQAPATCVLLRARGAAFSPRTSDFLWATRDLHAAPS